MYLFVFQEKLARLNPLLYVDTTAAMPLPNGDGRHVASIRYRKGRADSRKSANKSVLSGDAERYLTAHEDGQIDEVIGGCPTEWVPEYDLLDPKAERPRLLARGWRAIVMDLVNKKFCTLEKAKRVFSGSLGETRFEKMTMRARWEQEFPEMARITSGDTSDIFNKIRY